MDRFPFPIQAGALERQAQRFTAYQHNWRAPNHTEQTRVSTTHSNHLKDFVSSCLDPSPPTFTNATGCKGSGQCNPLGAMRCSGPTPLASARSYHCAAGNSAMAGCMRNCKDAARPALSGASKPRNWLKRSMARTTSVGVPSTTRTVIDPAIIGYLCQQ